MGLERGGGGGIRQKSITDGDDTVDCHRDGIDGNEGKSNRQV